MKIKLKQVQDAIENTSDTYTYYFDTQAGETGYLVDQYIAGETDEELEARIENFSGRYLRLSTKYNIHEYQIMEMLIGSLPDGTAKQELFPQFDIRERFEGSKTGFTTTGSNSGGTTSGRKPSGRSPLADVGTAI